jgi:anti-sigma factor RsiW
MKNVKSEDLRMLHRLADGEDLAPGQRAAFENRIAAEPALAEAMEQLRSLRGMFVPGRSAAPQMAPVGFTDGVLAAVRQQALAGAATSARTGGADRTVVICRRILLLAAAIVVAAVVLHTWILTSHKPDHLQAAPDEVQKVIKCIDQGLKDAAAGKGADRR